MKKSNRFKDITKDWVSNRRRRGKVVRAKSVTIDGKKYYKARFCYRWIKYLIQRIYLYIFTKVKYM